MSISQEAIQKILGIGEEIPLEPGMMARNLRVTFFPYSSQNASKDVKNFVHKLKQCFNEIGVTIVPYEAAWATIPLLKMLKRTFLVLLNNILVIIGAFMPINVSREKIPFSVLTYLRKRKKIKKGVSVIAIGDSETGKMPIDHTMSFRETLIVTIVDMPEDITTDTDFHAHFDKAMKLFAHHMTNIIIAVDHEKWLLYNFNASHPIYPHDKNFKQNILHALIPKIAAPIRPHRFKDFVIDKTNFDIGKKPYKKLVEDMISSGELLEKTGLYPKGKLIQDLPFRNEFYQWVGKIHLDHRSGMSYGFLARQLPVNLPQLIPFNFNEAKQKFGNYLADNKDYFIVGSEIYLIIRIPSGKFCMKVPEVMVLTQRSGANKTNINPHIDLLIMGIRDGKMFLRTPLGLKIKSDYKSSFDTKVILAHAVGNAIIASILKHLAPGNQFANTLEKDGLALAHWHGYIKREYVPRGWRVHGTHNPHVACSTAQAAIYALHGKIQSFIEGLKNKKEEYFGDVHIEPHHGTNMTFNSLEELGQFLNSNVDASKLGNIYLDSYE